MKTNTTKIRFDRLKKLAEHLLHGKLGHKKFDFSVYHEGEKSKYHCGTLGCALGECPVLFKKDWAFYTELDIPILRNKDFGALTSAKEFFGIEELAVEHLFYPKMQNTKNFGGKFLTDKATRRQVANNILAFIERMKQ